ncbi:MAG: aspartate carbamoyltransferase, partial [Actinobacteria bacterium]|nr:aspartate carbamoyltransferase [Actinomycetota bacterium]
MKHLLSAADLSYEDAILVLDTAKQLAAATEQGVGKLP